MDAASPLDNLIRMLIEFTSVFLQVILVLRIPKWMLIVPQSYRPNILRTSLPTLRAHRLRTLQHVQCVRRSAPSSGSSNTHIRSRSHAGFSGNWRWYHQSFGEEARKCISRCPFHKPPQSNGHAASNSSSCSTLAQRSALLRHRCTAL